MFAPLLPLAVAWMALTAPAPQEVAPEQPARPRQTVLRLEGGQVLRGRAREVEGGWEIRIGKDDRFVPAALVARATPESELLAQARKLRGQVPRDDHVRRVAYADWLVEQGLYVEALRELDRVLEAEPDQTDARALLERSRIPVGLPATPFDEASSQGFLAAASRLTPCGRVLALQRLREAPEILGLRTALGNELVATASDRRGFAAQVLRDMFPGSELQSLLSRAVLDTSPEVRVEAALALRDAENPAVLAPVVRAMGSRNANVRTNAIEALGRMEYREAVEPLVNHLANLASGSNRVPHTYAFFGKQLAYIQDFDVEVAQNESIADPIINVLQEGAVLDVGVIGVNQYVVSSERAAAKRALGTLTGASPGDTTAAWTRWWEEHGDAWRAGAAPYDSPTSPAGSGR
jgi:hypothetical protein